MDEKEKLRKKLCEPFDGLKTETVDELEKMADEYALSFVNWIVEFQKIKGILFRKDFSTKELLTIFKGIKQ